MKCSSCVVDCCSYFQDGLKTIEHFHCYIEELVVELGRLKQKQDTERRNLVELRDVLRNFMSSYKDVSLSLCLSVCLFVFLCLCERECVSVDCGVSDLVELRDVLRNFMSSYKDVSLCLSVCLSVCLSLSV